MKTLLSLILVALLVTALMGCNSTRNVSYGHIVNNLTPELKGLSERPSDDRTAYKMASNQNMRSFWDDLGRALVIDSPSRLTPVPVVNTSGQHR